MLFSNLVFLTVFLPLFFITYFVIKNRTYRNFVLLMFSLVFYAWGEPIYILLMLFSIIINYLFAIEIDKRKDKKRKNVFILAIAINILLLVIFKYLGWLTETINVIPSINLPILKLSLPIGISFYTFQIMSYVISVYQRNVKVQKNIIFLGCYVVAFPQLIAGPIVRYETVAKELNDRKENLHDFAEGTRRFIVGLAKKVIVADNLAYMTDTIFAGSFTDYGAIGAWLGMIAYTLQIYYDFSAYSDMAIGMGRMLGFYYLENFNYPYIAKSITDFWRRWHISLSSFFRDYVYIPLGGNRKKQLRNILIVWLLTGLWHGAAWNFLIWGLYFGILLVLEKFVWGKALAKLPAPIQNIYTLFLVIISWVIFRSNGMSETFEILKSMFFLNGLGSFEYLKYIQVLQFRHIIITILAIIFAYPLYINFQKKIEKNHKLTLALDIFLVILFLVTLVFILSSSYSPFIYFRF